jgi:hypothetical protein
MGRRRTGAAVGVASQREGSQAEAGRGGTVGHRSNPLRNHSTPSPPPGRRLAGQGGRAHTARAFGPPRSPPCPAVRAWSPCGSRSAPGRWARHRRWGQPAPWPRPSRGQHLGFFRHFLSVHSTSSLRRFDAHPPTAQFGNRWGPRWGQREKPRFGG